MNSKPTSPSLDSGPPDPDDDRSPKRAKPKKRSSASGSSTPRSSHSGQRRDSRSAAAKRDARADVVVKLDYPEELPITARREEIVEMIRNHQVIVVCGETGSGKSTQLPKFCLEAGLGREGMIGHTQPRRLAARSIASRLADETESTLGDAIGYQIRFGDQTSDRTLIKLMTDGILLAEIGSDRRLENYDVIIIDEAHERSLNIDFLIGYLRNLQESRPELKVIITSATIDAERFAEHFGSEDQPAPIINVEGRGYPVEMRYLPWEDVVDEGFRGYDLSRHVIAGLDSVSKTTGGDVLVFLPTERDIREVSHRVGGHFARLGLAERVDLLPLYARLPSSQQQRIFSPASGGKRRIIFATNVAESSLTVPGISAVVDTGTARISRYAARSRVQRLPIESISRASADQRAGRCGRIGPGVCVRLYSAEDYETRDDFTTPEIRRTHLASVVLQMKTLRLGNLESFPLIDPPRREAVREGMRTLHELAAIDDHEELTPIGWRLGRMPVDPRVGRILLAAEANGVLPEILPIAAALEIPDPRDRPPEKREAADQAHREFKDPQSDFLSLLRLWRHYETLRSDLGHSKLERTLRKQFLSPNRMREWSDIYRQLRDAVKQSSRDKVKIGNIRYAEEESQEPDKPIVDQDRYALIHQSLLAGLLSGVAMIGDKKLYTGAGGLQLALWPGSGVFESKPKWIVAAELVETAKAYARTVARIQPGWIENVGAHLLKKSHQDPHWSDKSSGAFCYENQTLFGLPIVVRRRVPLPPIDPLTARDLMIEPGLAEDRLQTKAQFVRHNQQLVESIESLAAKTRRRDLVIDPFQIARFYQERLPAEIFDKGRLEKYDRETPCPDWTASLKTAADVSAFLAGPTPRDSDQETLYMRPDDLVEMDSVVISQEAFPDELTVGGSKLPLEYRFEPGGERDGVNIKVHAAAITQISDGRLGWLVPGLLPTKITSMIKSLPKRIRRNLVPAADVAAKIAEELQEEYGKVPFETAICAAISRHAEMSVTIDDFQEEKMDGHLRMLVSVVDDDGNTIAEGRNVAPLVRKAAATGDQTSLPEDDGDEADDEWKREDMKTFDIERLPAEVVRVRGGVEVAQFPGLVIDGDRVATSIFPDRGSAERSLAAGATALYAIKTRKELRSQIRHLPALADAKLKIGGWLGGNVENSLERLLARIAFVEREKPLRSNAEYQRRLDDKNRRIYEATVKIAGWLSQLTEHGFAARKEIESFKSGKNAPVVADVTRQQKNLIFEGWLDRVPWQWIEEYPRYLRGIAYRLDKLRHGGASRDDESMRIVHQLQDGYLAGKAVESPESPESPEPSDLAEDEVRWMIEELRVSLFAQPLGTSVKVSPKRIEKMLGAK